MKSLAPAPLVWFPFVTFNAYLNPKEYGVVPLATSTCACVGASSAALLLT